MTTGDPIFGKKLADLMVKKGINQVEMAKKLRVTQATISQWISGHSYPRYPKMKMLLRILDCTPDELFGGPPSVGRASVEIKRLDFDELIAALEKEGFPADAVAFVRKLHRAKLQPWQVEAIDAIMKAGGQKKEE